VNPSSDTGRQPPAGALNIAPMRNPPPQPAAYTFYIEADRQGRAGGRCDAEYGDAVLGGSVVRGDVAGPMAGSGAGGPSPGPDCLVENIAATRPGSNRGLGSRC